MASAVAVRWDDRPVARRDLTGSSGLSRLGLSSRSGRSNRWLSYEASRRLQRDALTGIVMVLVAAIGLLLIGAFTDSFDVRFDNGVPVADGKECQLLQVVSADDPSTPLRPIVDCGDEAGIGFSAVVRHVFVALGAVGVFLLLSAIFSLLLSSRMPRETLAVPFCVAAILLGVVALWWGLGDMGGPALVIQGDRDRAVVGLLRSGGQFTTEHGAVSAGVGLIAASIVRLTRPV
ncbi:MAG: hypothetical protein RL547_148 [Actinomycetota bacterium]